MTEDSLLSLSVDDLLSAAAARTPAPGGGAAAALVTALAAALAAMAARYAEAATDAADDSSPLVQRAEDLRRSAAQLADDDAAAYGRYLEAIRISRDYHPDRRRDAVRAALSDATDVPLAIAALAAEVAGLAAGLTSGGNANVRGDAAAATVLASAAATTAALLVNENLSKDPADARRSHANDLADSAQGAADVVIELLRPHEKAPP